MTKVPHVALLIETSRSYGRGLLRGVRRYVSENGPWSVFMELRALESKVPGWLKDWQGDGILTRSNSQVMACTDQLGFWLLDACKRAGVAVPEEVAAIAVKTGFKHPQYMAEAFKREFGQTPGEFRAVAKKRQKS